MDALEVGDHVVADLAGARRSDRASSSDRRPRPISSEALPRRLTLKVERKVCSPTAGGAERAASGTRTSVEFDIGGADQPQPIARVTCVRMPGSVMSTRKLVRPSSAIA